MHSNSTKTKLKYIWVQGYQISALFGVLIVNFEHVITRFKLPVKMLLHSFAGKVLPIVDTLAF